ncbi:MAG: heat-inducible transcriptional repressor HrcA [Armatimonadota bacterium]|nr:heat-inducible transcriptional repressor HrcA [Armatimonadota bacterium]
MRLEDRKRAVLCAVVEEHIRSAEPVGSEHPVLLEHLGCSSATIRSAMAALEDEGLLTHPHTSAGRVPTDYGYRVYVDMVLAGPLPASERQAIRRDVGHVAGDATDLGDQAAHILSLVTRYASVVAPAGLRQQTFDSLHLLAQGPGRALAVITTSAGTLQGRLIDLPPGVAAADLEQLSRVITQRLHGMRIADLTQERLEQVIGEASRDQQLVDAVKAWLRRDLARGSRPRFHVEGARHLLNEPEFSRPEAATQVLSALEEHTVLAQALAAVPEQGVWIAIGSENRLAELRACSVVAAPYGVGHDAGGTVAIVGPTRMRYRRAVAAVQYVADRLTEALRRSA